MVKKFLAALIAVIMSAALFVGCGNIGGTADSIENALKKSNFNNYKIVVTVEEIEPEDVANPIKEVSTAIIKNNLKYVEASMDGMDLNMYLETSGEESYVYLPIEFIATLIAGEEVEIDGYLKVDVASEYAQIAYAVKALDVYSSMVTELKPEYLSKDDNTYALKDDSKAEYNAAMNEIIEELLGVEVEENDEGFTSLVVTLTNNKVSKIVVESEESNMKVTLDYTYGVNLTIPEHVDMEEIEVDEDDFEDLVAYFEDNGWEVEHGLVDVEEVGLQEGSYYFIEAEKDDDSVKIAYCSSTFIAKILEYMASVESPESDCVLNGNIVYFGTEAGITAYEAFVASAE